MRSHAHAGREDALGLLIRYRRAAFQHPSEQSRAASFVIRAPNVLEREIALGRVVLRRIVIISMFV